MLINKRLCRDRTLGTVQDTETYEYFGQSSTDAWGDVLLRYDSINYNVYDAIGNPTRYFNETDLDEVYTFSWQNGRQLASGTKGETPFAYTYIYLKLFFYFIINVSAERNHTIISMLRIY